MQRSSRTALLPLDRVFKEIKTGDIHASSRLDPGEIPLVSCTETDYGVEGYFAIPEGQTYRNVVTIACDGQPLTAFYHPYTIAVKDNVIVATPRDNTPLSVIYFTVAHLNKMKWRFNYGRKCYLNKVDKLRVPYPVDEHEKIDQSAIVQDFKVHSFGDILPKKTKNVKPALYLPRFQPFQMSQLFQLERGDFHSLSKLEEGKYATVSRIATDNGIVGHFKRPLKAHIYPPSLITVSTVAGDAFVQVEEFMSTDNVVICIPKPDLRLTTLYFIQTLLNRMKWRYSYGRQCYKTKFAQTTLHLPVKSTGEIDEDAIEQVVRTSPYWDYVDSNLTFQIVNVSTFESVSGKKMKKRRGGKTAPLEAFAS